MQALLFFQPDFHNERGKSEWKNEREQKSECPVFILSFSTVKLENHTIYRRNTNKVH